MERPCTCERAQINQPYTLEQCRICWLWHHDARYHQLWGGDPKDLIRDPGWLEKVVNFSRAMVQHVATGMKTASNEVYQQRLGICQRCEFFRDNHCLKCGCWVAGDMIAKARWESSVCPIGRW